MMQHVAPRTTPTVDLPTLLGYIKFLIKTGRVRFNTLYPINPEQLSQESDFRLRMFARVIEDKWVDYGDKKAFDNFLGALASDALKHDRDNKNPEYKHAEYLFGALLLLSVQVQIEAKSYGLKDLMFAQIPMLDIFMKNHEGPFMKTEWRAARNYPTLHDFMVWQKQENIRQREAALQFQRDASIVRAQLEAYNRWRAQHHFDNLMMSYHHLTLAIESFMRRGGVGFFNSSVQNPFKLSESASLDLDIFIKWTRHNVEIETVRASFKNMIYQLIKDALKPGPYQYASNRMLGFFMYHNFRVLVAGEALTMEEHIENIWKEKEELLGDYKPYLLAHDSMWRKAQNYPGKDEMTYIMNQAYAPRPMMPMCQQQAQPRPLAAPLPKAEPMDLDENENLNINKRQEEVLDYLFGKDRPNF